MIQGLFLKNLFISAVIILNYSVGLSQSGWFFLDPPVSGYMTAIQFTNQQTGFVARFSDGILRTSNSGASFELITVPSGSSLYALHFPDPNTGYAAGLNGRVLKSTNSGLSWYLLNPGVSVTLNSVSFLNSETGYIAGYNTKVLYTTNGGTSWVDRSLGLSVNIISAFFTSQDTGYVGTASGTQQLFRTTNGGINWVQQSIPNVFLLFVKSIQFINSNTGYFVGDVPFIFRTTNSGVSWDTTYSGAAGARFLDVFFGGSDTGYAVGEGVICKTTNGGSSWFMQNRGTSPYINSVYFTNANTGYAVTTLGQILKTTTGGGQITGVNLTSEALPEKFELVQNYPNPFNPLTKIDIPSILKRETGNVRLVIFDMLGREVATLVNEQLKPGTYEVDWDASAYPSGVYFYRLQAGEYTKTNKMVLIK
jgi:photosystem II stability/assembly factor-like uncharacterized protein